MKDWIISKTAIMMRRRWMRRNRIGVEPDDQAATRVLRAAASGMRQDYLTFITAGADGPTARIVWGFKPTPDLTVHVATDPESTKARQAVATGKAVLAYSSGVTAYCDVEILDDQADLDRWWIPMFFAFWPNGPKGNYVVLRCRPYRMDVYSPKTGIAPAPVGLRAGHIERVHESWRLVNDMNEAK